MSLPHTIYESKLAHNDMRRERSMQVYENLRHLPQGDSLLKRLVRRLQAASGRTIGAAQRPAVPESMDTSRPPAFSR